MCDYNKCYIYFVKVLVDLCDQWSILDSVDEEMLKIFIFVFGLELQYDLLELKGLFNLMINFLDDEDLE